MYTRIHAVQNVNGAGLVALCLITYHMTPRGYIDKSNEREGVGEHILTHTRVFGV